MKDQTTITNKTKTTDEAILAQPIMNQTADEIQKFGTRFRVPLGWKIRCVSKVSQI